MLRTVMTLRISSKDFQDTTFLVNDTHVGYLAAGGKRNQVFSSNRNIQLIAAFEADQEDDGAQIQRELIALWHRGSRDIQQRGISFLPKAVTHYGLNPQLLISLDNKYLNAFLSNELRLCLLRDKELFEVDPVADEHSKMPEQWYGKLSQSTVEIREQDYFLLLPPEVFEVVSPVEVQNILNGIQQLAVKINELVELCRIRNYIFDASWIAMQIQKVDYDYVQAVSISEKVAAFINQFRKQDPQEQARQSAESSSLRHPSEISFSEQAQEEYEDSDIEIFSDDDFQPSEAQRAMAAARAGMKHNRGRTASDSDYPDGQGSASKGVAAELKGRSQKDGIFSFWYRWRREQRWLAVLLALSFVIIFIWGVTSLTSKDKPEKKESTPVENVQTSQPTPIPTTQTTSIEPEEEKWVVAVHSLNFREAPSTDAGLIVSLNEGSVVVRISDPVEGWMKVKLEDGREAYVFAEYLEKYTDAGADNNE